MRIKREVVRPRFCDVVLLIFGNSSRKDAFLEAPAFESASHIVPEKIAMLTGSVPYSHHVCIPKRFCQCERDQFAGQSWEYMVAMDVVLRGKLKHSPLDSQVILVP